MVTVHYGRDLERAGLLLHFFLVEVVSRRASATQIVAMRVQKDAAVRVCNQFDLTNLVVSYHIGKEWCRNSSRDRCKDMYPFKS